MSNNKPVFVDPMHAAQTDKEFFKYTIAIHKAISKEENAVKQKHVRSAIIGTFHHQGAEVFWSIAIRLPVMEEVIVAWKFCYVLHKVLREGHPLCVTHSMRHRSLIQQIGKLWGHLDGYGKLISLYSSLLSIKLNFHNHNPQFPNNLAMTHEKLMQICGGNADNCFQLSVEIFDYLDGILELQKSIYSLTSSSMTMQGQCRLGAIIPCIQDASRLYDHNVKILYRLHSMVDYDVLEGHRTRFNRQYRILKKFYESTNNMQYFKNLISIPALDNPPNFRDHFNTYVTQEVVVPQDIEPEDNFELVNLIDTSDHNVPDVVDTVPPIPPKPATVVAESPLPPNFDIIVERDNIIKSLRENVSRLRCEIIQVNSEKDQETTRYKAKVTELEESLAAKQEELIREKETFNSIISVQEDEKAKEEKFRTQYKKVRDEHITLLREKAKIEKSLKSAEHSLSEMEAKNKTSEEQLSNSEKKIESLELQLRAAQEISTKLESLKLDNQGIEQQVYNLKKELQDTLQQKENILIELDSIKLENSSLRDKRVQLEKSLEEKDIELIAARKDAEIEREALFKACLATNIKVVIHALEEVDNPALSALICSPDYLNSLSTICLSALQSTASLEKTSDEISVIELASNVAYSHATYILQGRATSNTCPDISFGEKMAEACKALGKTVVVLLEAIKDKKPTFSEAEKCTKQLNNVKNLTEEINNFVRGDSNENLESMLEAEMIAMDKAIEDAVKQMEEMLSQSRVNHSGIKLEVNERILDKCTTLMEAIRILVQKSRLLQAEIVSQGKGTASSKEFYKRNHQWTDGFISAAKAVGTSARFLLSVADKAVATDGRLEPLVVAAQNISASTTQLVFASRVKASRHSVNLNELSGASKNVTNATAAIVATVKDCSKLIDETSEIDTSNLSLHNSKRLEMDSQVRVLELEKELELERLRLAQLRKHHYQLEDEAEKQLKEAA